MTKDEFNKKLNDLDLSIKDFSNLLGVSYVSVSRWCSDKNPLPQYAKIVLDLYEYKKNNTELLEILEKYKIKN